tara:strand:- start:1198 stop:1731 length:534 start_codon:yes stop_codon:yes gene_type:complete
MREGIHPEYSEIRASCSCGNVILIKSTLKEDIQLDVCSSCHPFYTGKQKLVDTGGRVEKFKKRFGKKAKPKEEIKTEKVKEVEEQDISNEVRENLAEEPVKKAGPKKKVTKKAAKDSKASKTSDTKEAKEQDISNEVQENLVEEPVKKTGPKKKIEKKATKSSKPDKTLKINKEKSK